MHRRTAKSLISAATLAALLLTVSACASESAGSSSTSSSGSASSTLAKIKKDGVVTVVTTGNGPPDSFTVNGEHTGTMPTLMEAIAKDWGVKIKWQESTFSGLISAVQSGRAQVMADGLFITPQRAEQVSFSGPIYGWSDAIAQRSSDTTTYPDLKSLQGKTVGVITSTVEADALNALGGVTVKSYDTYQELVQDLSAGRIDAALVDPPSVNYLVTQDPSLKVKVSDHYHGTDPFFVGFAVAHNDPALASAIDDELVKMHKSGQLQKIVHKFEGNVGILVGSGVPSTSSPTPSS